MAPSELRDSPAIVLTECDETTLEVSHSSRIRENPYLHEARAAGAAQHSAVPGCSRAARGVLDARFGCKIVINLVTIHSSLSRDVAGRVAASRRRRDPCSCPVG